MIMKILNIKAYSEMENMMDKVKKEPCNILFTFFI